ncbi:MAG: Lrp/AsnC family transcriptional regulator [Mesorhizobium sp.]|uniref:Lrp/AsnC family transcriptional regulator n=1 Tax=Mesorhizobium sp. TaxID=1871066 RepID=UPI0011FD5936|nr:Lrp/AsnC family transcriptional regulator [Mesorhizobium sp.]TIL19595.1 MAG: Lrp/AsnC family transcriptional regulator [Mesorhizobium sp.]TIQ35928.1 MAG: Lrp/AsnC family transcriptional regulator [Mesorhizobium sp.]TIW59584.1 MAG: Lrp/AsnC family transcriptional regulator [Mesorhizobium sp.]TJW31180.1 MAG: Lrp/AsnC family transcriptional regulator [Mesorhizobium sp.]
MESRGRGQLTSAAAGQRDIAGQKQGLCQFGKCGRVAFAMATHCCGILCRPPSQRCVKKDVEQDPIVRRVSDMNKLDRMDYRILDVLQENGRLPIKILADRVGISVSPCWQRVKKLEKDGIIRRYVAEIAIEKLQSVQIVLAKVALSKHHREALEFFERNMCAIPEVVECYEVMGQFDYHMKFVVSSIDRYTEIVERFLTPEFGVERYFTDIVSRVAKEDRAIQLRSLV